MPARARGPGQGPGQAPSGLSNSDDSYALRSLPVPARARPGDRGQARPGPSDSDDSESAGEEITSQNKPCLSNRPSTRHTHAVDAKAPRPGPVSRQAAAGLRQQQGRRSPEMADGDPTLRVRTSPNASYGCTLPLAMRIGIFYKKENRWPPQQMF